MKILITGGMGYIGGRLASQLSEKGHEIFLGTRKSLKSLDEPLSKTIPVQTDWDNYITLLKSTKRIDAVIHAAGMGAKECFENPAKALQVNGLNTAKIMEASIANGVEKFIYLSTVHVYKSPLVGEIDETTTPTNLHPYATSKLAGEKVVLFEKHMDKIQAIVLRLSNGSGHPIFPKTKCWHLILNDLCRQAVEKKELILHSEKSIERNFISMSNICFGIVHFLQLSEKHLEASPFNVCNEKSHSLQQLAHLITTRCKAVLGYDLEILSKSHEKKNKNNKGLYLLTKKSKKTGLTLNQNLEQEIDNTLLFCETHFSTSS